MSKIELSVQQVLRLLQLNLFKRRDLLTLFKQLKLAFPISPKTKNTQMALFNGYRTAVVSRLLNLLLVALDTTALI
jgi:hypothetical protein